MSQKDFDILSIIALRKSKFYQKTRDKLLRSLPRYVDQKEARLRLRKAMAERDNDLFIDEREKATKTIDPALPLERLRLNRQEIIRQVLKKLTG